jgi:hypothetical protein
MARKQRVPPVDPALKEAIISFFPNTKADDRMQQIRDGLKDQGINYRDINIIDGWLHKEGRQDIIFGLDDGNTEEADSIKLIYKYL